MNIQFLIQILALVASAIEHLVPLIQQGQAVLSATDAQSVKTALTKAETATATLRPQVDAALSAAAAQT